MKKIKILFQGDSITDADRDRSDCHNMGYGYANFVVQKLTTKYPDVDLEFINLGLSGNRTDQLFDRLTPDCVELDPDIVSILIGINDVWHRYEYEFIPTTDEQIALNFKCILERIKRETNAKIVMLAPYVLDNETKDKLRDDLVTVRPIIRALAEEYADTRRLSKLILRPAYARYGKAAPLKRNEEMVDWFAIQFPKLLKTFRELGV